MLDSFSNFCDVNPCLGFVVIMNIGLVFLCVIASSYYAVKLFLRSLNIRKQGWPPIYCDADGNYIYLEDEDEDEDDAE